MHKLGAIWWNYTQNPRKKLGMSYTQPFHVQFCLYFTMTDFACYKCLQVACISLQQLMAGAHQMADEKLETN